MNCIPNRLVFLSLVISSSLTANIINVPADYSTIQAALTAAQSGDTVLVQPGTYYENIFWPDVNGIKLISAGDSSNTIIVGSGNGSVIYLNPSTATIDSTTEIQGFKITNGGNIANGGGMFIGSASPVLTRLWVTGNTASINGGGLYIDGSPTLTDVTVTGNTASSGGGLCIDGGSPTLTDVTAAGNTASYGGGLRIHYSNPTLTYVTVTGNTASRGGGLCIDGGSPTLTGVTVTGNTASSTFHGGGGLYINSSSPTLTDVTVTSNTGNGLCIYYCSPALTDVTVTGNTGNGLYIDYGGLTLTDGTVTGNTGNGLYIYYGSLTLTRTTVSRNLGAGLYFREYSGALVNVTITGNTRGIYVESGTPTVAGSNIAYHGAGLYNADNTNIIEATDNWWGDSSGPYHPQYNPGGLGDSVNTFVDITPFLTVPDTAAPPIPIQNVTIDSIGTDFIGLSWDASPIGDFAGYKVYYDTDSTGFPYADTVDAGSVNYHVLDGLDLGFEYFIAVTCYDTDGNESWYSREVAATVSPVPRIAVSSSTIDFDATMVGATAVASLQVSNTGTADLNVSQVASGDPQFVASPGSFTVPVGGQQDVTVSFIPTSYGLVSDTLTIISDAYNDPELPVLVQGFGDLPEAPVILSIVDVDDPPDQGGQVRIDFARSKYDGLDTSQAIASYSIWRHIEGDEWDAIGRFDAVQDSIYHYVAPTLCDSTWEGICWSIFKVSAHTDDPDAFYFSPPDSGYSIDNIAPGVPTGLLASESDSGVVLTWHPNTETDFQYYAVYRSTQPGFYPDTMEAFLFSTADTHFVDTDVQTSTTYYYRISAFDYAGNESGFSEEVSITILGVSRKYGIPAEYALHPGYPNPFNPSITLPYDLPEATDLALVVYDVLGREIIRLADGYLEPGFHQVVWNGRDNAGREVPTGIYIARMITPQFTKSIKMVLLK